MGSSGDEMRAAKVRHWQVLSCGNALHGFINPAAGGSMIRAALYGEQADRRSRASMKSLLDEAFGAWRFRPESCRDGRATGMS